MDTESKIWPLNEVFYIEGLLSITRTVLSEKLVANTFLDEYRAGEIKNQKLLLDSVQNIICQAALLSKYFWPVRKNAIHKNRGERLREAYLITDSNCLKSRVVRDYIEHFDEKLDNYLSTFVIGSVIPLYLGPRIYAQGKHIFRGYFTDEAVFTILGIEYNVIPIVEEVERLHFMLEEDAKTGRIRFNPYH